MRTLRVFEHETVRIGGSTLSGAPSPLKQADIDALSRFNDQAGRSFFRFGYRSVSFTNMVGYVEVGDLAIEVLPKADRTAKLRADHPWHNALLTMLELALGVQLFDPTRASQAAAPSSLFDLVAAAFVREVGKIVQEGLSRSYRMTEANGPTFRGRLLVAEHIRANVGRDDRVYVRFATFDRDVPVNQIIAKAIAAISDRPISGDVRARLTEVAYAFADLLPIRIEPGFFDRLALGRSTARYETVLKLARLILERQAPSLRSGGVSVFAVLFDMNILWELYVASIFRRACGSELSVQTQARTPFWKAKGYTARVAPDLVIRRRNQKAPVLICDTKWKVLDGAPPHDDHLKQMFVYNELFGCPHAVLIHPRCAPDEGMTGAFAVGGRQCSTATLGLFEGGKLRHPEMTAEVGALVARFATPGAIAGEARSGSTP